MADVNGVNRIDPPLPAPRETPKTSPKPPKDPRGKPQHEEAPTKEDDSSASDVINEYV